MPAVKEEKAPVFDTSGDRANELLEQDMANVTSAISALTVESLRPAALGRLSSDLGNVAEFLKATPHAMSIPDEIAELGPKFASKLIKRIAQDRVPTVNDGTQLLKILLSIDDQHPGTINKSARTFAKFLSNVNGTTNFGLEIEALGLLGQCIGRCDRIPVSELKEHVDQLLIDSEDRREFWQGSDYRLQKVYPLVEALAENRKREVVGMKPLLDRLVADELYSSITLAAMVRAGVDVVSEYRDSKGKSADFGRFNAIRQKAEKLSEGETLNQLEIDTLTTLATNKEQWWYMNATAFELLCQHAPETALSNALKLSKHKDDDVRSAAAISMFRLPISSVHIRFAENILKAPFGYWMDNAQEIVLKSLGNGGSVNLKDGQTDFLTRGEMSSQVKVEKVPELSDKQIERVVEATADFMVREYNDNDTSLREHRYRLGIDVLNRWKAADQILQVYRANKDQWQLTKDTLIRSTSNWDQLKRMYSAELKKTTHEVSSVGALTKLLPNPELEQYLISTSKESLFRAFSAVGSSSVLDFNELIERDRAGTKRMLLAVVPEINTFLKRGDIYNVDRFFSCIREIEKAEQSEGDNPMYMI